MPVSNGIKQMAGYNILNLLLEKGGALLWYFAAMTLLLCNLARISFIFLL